MEVIVLRGSSTSGLRHSQYKHATQASGFLRGCRNRCAIHSLASRACIVVLAVLLPSAGAAEVSPAKNNPAANRFFENKIRPLLAEHCYKCHGSKKQKSKMRLDSLGGMLAGGEAYGAAIVPGNPDKSVLIDAINFGELEMPPKKKLSKTQIADLTQWVRIGAPWPGSATIVNKKNKALAVSAEDRAYWAFQPVRRPKTPAVREAKRKGNPIDSFVLSRLEKAGLDFSPPATPRQLIRRVYFDLIGLPPTPQQVATFEKNPSPKAYSGVIDQLLKRPEYGERWGRHWLDVVRFAQTNGYERDDEKPLAWRYRDYVIKAFNDDLPYDQFVLEQLAGDELDKVTDDSIAATGFYRLGVWDDEPDDKRQAEFDGLDDMLVTTGTAMFGLTLGCARCHDHKFDPIPQADYYHMLAFLRNVRRYSKPGKNASIFAPLPSGGRTLAVSENGRKVLKTHLLIRGNSATPGKQVAPQFLEVLCRTKKMAVAKLPAASPNGKSTGRRRVMAEWIASADHPLTARVMVNRIWQHHFGQGIVATPNDFGKAGIRPTHPELLDWLAADFIEGGWRIKRMHRQIMLSNAYRQSSLSNQTVAIAKDPGNTLLWRQNLRRLEAEAIRDSILAVAGTLNSERGGRGFFPRISGEVVAGQSKPGRGWEVSSPVDRRRRSIYAFVKRGLMVPLLESFDYVNSTSTLPVRPTTTVAPQALLLLNGRFIDQQAAALADRITREAPSGLDHQVRRAYELALARAPNSSESTAAVAFIQRQQKGFAARADQITFWPDVPVSLERGYRARLKVGDYLIGPREGWAYHRGIWGGGYENIDVVEVPRGPFALWTAEPFSDATLNTRFKLHRGAESGGLLFRSAAKGDAQTGYELHFDPRRQRIELRYHLADAVPKTLASAKLPLQTGHWHDLKLETTGPRIRVWLDQSTTPTIDVVHKNGPRDGSIGVRCWRAAISLDRLVIEQSGRQWKPSRITAGLDSKHPAAPKTVSVSRIAGRQALAAFCKVIFNLNEFVYVD